MGWPTCKAKFGSSSPCKACKTTYVAGATIYKINEDHWCSNPDCPKKKAETMRTEPLTSSHVSSKLTLVSKERIAYHDNAWEIALAKATGIYPPDIKEFEGIKVDKTLTSRMILAQVFYKALMGVS